MFSYFAKTVKNGNFYKKSPVHKQKLTSRVLTQPPKFSTEMAHGYPSKSKMRSYFIKQFIMNKATFHTGTKGHG